MMHSNQAGITVLTNDNYCVPQWCLMGMVLMENFQTLNVNCCVTDHVTFVIGQLKKRKA